MNQSPKRIVVTGLGVISPLGLSCKQFWSNLQEGVSGVRPFSFQRPGDSPVAFAGQCEEFVGKADNFGEPDPTKSKAIRKATKLMSREIQMAVAAAQHAWADSGYVFQSDLSDRIGVSFGCDLIYSTVEDMIDGFRACTENHGSSDAKFDFSRWAIDGMTKMSPLWQLKYLSNMPSSHIAIINELRGPSNSTILREASVGAVLGEAVQTIRNGKVDLMVAGSTGSRIHPVKLIQTIQQEQIATISRPFDRNRSGMVPGEGAGALILESLDHAEKRGATIYAEILYGTSVACCGKYVKTQENQRDDCRQDYSEDALVSAMEKVFAETNRLFSEQFGPETTGHINAHGLSTVSADAAEARAINRVFGSRKKAIPITTCKGHFGNLGAGGGMVELIAGIFALNENRLFPTLNFETPDSDCPIEPVRVGDEKPSGDSLIKLAFNSQGQASAVLLRKF